MTSNIFFSVASTPNAIGASVLALYFLGTVFVAIAARRFVFDVFRNDSPAQSSKRLVPWSAEAAILVFLCGAFLFPIGALGVVQYLPPSWTPDFAGASKNVSNEKGASDDEETPPTKSDDLATTHPMARLLIRASETPWKAQVFFVCLLTTTLAAPIAEEFIYRVLFQGSLENFAFRSILEPSGDRRFRWSDVVSSPERRSFYLRSAVAILVPAFVFALAHFGAPETPEEAAAPDTLARLYRAALAIGLANVATLLFGIFFLRRFFAAQPEDFGFGPEFSLRRGFVGATLKRIAIDFFRGFVLFLYAAPFVFGTNVLLRALFPNAIVDPAPILVFALFEGIVYWRTRRFATVVGMHVGLNATSFLSLCVFWN